MRLRIFGMAAIKHDSTYVIAEYCQVLNLARRIARLTARHACHRKGFAIKNILRERHAFSIHRMRAANKYRFDGNLHLGS